MDAPTATPAAAAAPECDLCGYPRTGLPDGAFCPECGEPPPRLADAPAAPSADGASPQITAARLAYFRVVAVGLLLLVTSSITAVGVTLIMPVGPLTLPSVNVPAPKLHAAAFVQRSIGGEPGPWGVAGTIAAFTGLVALWLVTTPRSLRADEEATFSARRLARWVGVLSAGAVLGSFLSGVDPFIPVRGTYTGKMILFALVLCELPANGLLYWHLRGVAKDVGDRRAAAALERCAWLIPVLTGIAAATALYLMLRGTGRYATPQWPDSARVALALYGAAAAATGAAAAAAVIHLLGACAGQAAAGWLTAAGAAVGRLPAVVARVVGALAREPRRWAVVAGIVLWLVAAAKLSGFSLAYMPRYSHYREIPLMDFVGPKVAIVPFGGRFVLRYGQHMPENQLFRVMLLTLAAVWLMTWPRPLGQPRDRLATAARWFAVVAAGGMLGTGLWADAQSGIPFRHPRVVAATIAPVDALATVLVYLHLAAIAAAAGRHSIGRALRRLGIATAVLGMIPLGCFLYFAPLSPRNGGPWLLPICALQAAAVLAVSFLAASALARLAWALATTPTLTPATSAEKLGISLHLPPLDRPLRQPATVPT